MIDARQRKIALLVAGCFFMEILDGTIVTTAAPRIGVALHVSPTAIGLVVTSYFIAVAVLIPLSGWMVARFGTRRVFLSAIVIFTLASLLCATSVSLGELVVMRVLQGAGGAMMVPVGRLAVLAETAKPNIMRAISYIVWPALLAPVIAPLAGGLITTYASWRWLFLINIPLGVIALIAALRLMPSALATAPPRFDWVGVVLTCTGLGGLTYAAHLLSEPAAAWSLVLLVGALSVLTLAATARHLLRAPAPLVDLRTLHVRSFRTSLTYGSLFFMTFAAVPFLLPLLFETVFRWSAIKAGAVVLFIFVGNIGIKPATTFLLNRFGFRAILIAATTGLAATIIVSGLFSSATPLAIILVVTLLSGVARSVGATAFTTLAFSDIGESQMRHANSLAATAQQLAAGLGVAAATIALRVGAPLGSLFYSHETQASDYRLAFILLALVSLTATVGAVRLHPEAGNAVRTLRTKAAA